MTVVMVSSLSVCRDELNQQITGFSENVNYDRVAEILDPILRHQATCTTITSSCVINGVGSSCKDNDDDESTTDSSLFSGISPLTIACDKGQIETVRYLVDAYCGLLSAASSTSNFVAVVGSPLDRASPEVGGNTAFHHAALAGKVAILKHLCRYLGALEKENFQTMMNSSREEEDNTDYGMYYCRAAELRNAHGDTPLMMGSVSDHLDLVCDWLETIASANADNNTKLLELLRLRNDSSHSALSLSCGHGHVAMVQLLLQKPSSGKSDNVEKQAISLSFCPACHEDLVMAEKALQKMNELQHQHPQVARTEEFVKKRNQVQQCVELLRDALSKQADALAAELLCGEETSVNTPICTTTTTTKRKPKKKRRSKAKSTISNEDACCSAGKKNGEKNVKPRRDEDVREGSDSLSFKQLKDGTRAVVVQGETDRNTATTTASLTVPNLSSAPKSSADELFRKRFKDVEVSDIMDALCLDVSMLLLTPHGMALNLSASQLDAVDQILERQRNAIQQARAIQARLHETNQNHVQNGDGD